MASASGRYATASGSYTSASGNYALASGYYASCSGQYALAIGARTNVSGTKSTAVGYGASAGGNYSVAIGTGATASSAYSLILGGYAAGIGPQPWLSITWELTAVAPNTFCHVNYGNLPAADNPDALFAAYPAIATGDMWVDTSMGENMGVLRIW